MPKNATILMIRHGEKPDSGSDVGLTVAGQERAQAYAVYFQNVTVNGSQPLALSYLFAAADSSGSHRPRLTIQPLSQALGLSINDSYLETDLTGIQQEICGDPRYEGVNILICWHHEEILQLAEALGVDPSQLPASSNWPDKSKGWPGKVFGWVLQLCYDGTGDIIPDQTLCLNEQLMYDDYGQDPPNG
jgi:hypothetical protein